MSVLKKKKRLIISTGCYSTINAAAIMQEQNSRHPELVSKAHPAENYLFVFSRNYSESFIATNEELTEKLGLFKKLIFLKDIENFDNYENYFDEIFVPHYLEEALKLINLNPKAAVNWYDEGMASYAPIDDSKHSRIEKKLNGVYNVEYMDKIKSFLFPKTKRKKIDKTELLKVLDKAKDLITEDLTPYKKGKALILLSQNFSGINKILSEEQEISLYTEITGKLLQKGYTVLYKEHPRTINSFYEQIMKRVQDDRFINLEFKTNYPLEMYAQKLNPLGIISVFSTTNFCAPHLFDIPSFTFGTSFFIKTIEPKTHHDCFSAFIGELYIPPSDVIPNVNSMQEEEAKQKIQQVFKDFQNGLKDTLYNPLLKFKQIAAFNYIATQEEFEACKKLSETELSSEIFTQDDKKFLQKVKKQSYLNYWIQKTLSLNEDIIKAFKRFVRFPCEFNFKVLAVVILSHLNLCEAYRKSLKRVQPDDKVQENMNKYKNKKVLLYGAGMFFEKICQKYDLSKLNIIGISDRSFETSNMAKFCGYKIVKPSEINRQDFDVILVATLNSINIIEHLETVTNKKMMPLVEKDFNNLFEEMY